MGKRSLKRRIESLRQRMVEHQEKIAAEQKQQNPVMD